jgi:hypothetical protein
MVDSHTQSLIDQVTLHKLDYVRTLLRSAGLRSTGVREQLRVRLNDAVDQGTIDVPVLESLLGELDAWGNQHIRLGRLPSTLLAGLASPDAIEERVAAAGMTGLIRGAVDLVPSVEMRPMVISYHDEGRSRSLKLVAAKSREVLVEQLHIPDHVDDQFPGVVFKPFKVETHKIVGFAEIDLVNGLTVVSMTLVRRGLGYHAEFAELYSAFDPLISLNTLVPLTLYRAVQQIHALPQSEVLLLARHARTSIGGRIAYNSHSRRADMRSDEELNVTQRVLPDAPGVFCNCFWNIVDGLSESVHTHIHAHDGELLVLGQVKEDSVRYVLRRIFDFN